MTAHRYGARYEVCSRCGREWNVSLWAPVGGVPLPGVRRAEEEGAECFTGSQTSEVWKPP